jgi:DNA-binding Lrp family transcriptional regulator
VNLSVFGYSRVLTVVLRHPTGDNYAYYINEILNFLSKWGLVYMHITAAGGISAFGIAMRENWNGNYCSSNKEKDDDDENYGNIFESIREDLKISLSSNISISDIWVGKNSSTVSKKFRLREIDFRILDCLMLDPRMKFLDIARKVSASQRTVIRRFEQLEVNNVLVRFGIIHNPSMMKGYNYFSVIIHTDARAEREVMQKISYSKLNEYILRIPEFTFQDKVILNLQCENAFDIESLVEALQSLKGVKKVDVAQPLRIKWDYAKLLRKEIKHKIASINNNNNNNKQVYRPNKTGQKLQQTSLEK